MEQTLLLDNGYFPIDTISWKVAVRLLFLNKIEVIETYDKNLRSSYLIIKMPAVVRLINIFKRRKNKVKFSRQSIYIRDNYSCQYCGKKGRMNDFTFDHVIPRSQGGKTNWHNIVCCCILCNRKKANKTPKEAGMTLLKNPDQPTWLPALSIRVSQEHCPSEWVSYLYWNTELDQE